MKTTFLLSLMVASIAFNAQAASDDNLVKEAIRNSRLKITFMEDLETSFGEDGSFILQHGQNISKKELQKKEPYCTLTPDSPFKKDLTRAIYEKNQTLLGSLPDDAGGSFYINGKEFTGFSFGKKSFSFIAKGTFHDSERGGFKGADEEKSIIELTPSSIRLNFDCKNLSSDFSIRELKEITGDSIFNIEESQRFLDPYQLMLHSSFMKKKAAKKKADEEAKKEKEKANREAAIQALGTPAEPSLPVKDFKLGDAVTLEKEFKIYVEKSNYSGIIFQQGKEVGILGNSDEVYVKKTETLDQKKPYCKVMAAKYLRNAYTLEVPAFVGIYKAVKVNAYEFTKHFTATLDADVKFEEISATELRIVCENTSTVEDLNSVFGDYLKVYIK